MKALIIIGWLLLGTTIFILMKDTIDLTCQVIYNQLDPEKKEIFEQKWKEFNNEWENVQTKTGFLELQSNSISKR